MANIMKNIAQNANLGCANKKISSLCKIYAKNLDCIQKHYNIASKLHNTILKLIKRKSKIN